MELVKNKLIWHQVILIGVLALLSAWKLSIGRMFFGPQMVWWWFGAVIGFLMVFLDRFVYILLMKEEPLSKKFGELFCKGEVSRSMSTLLNERHEQRELVMRSALFLSAWMVLAIFAATSTMSFFAKGVILGVGTHLIFDFYADYLWNKDRFEAWFWQIKRQLPDNEKNIFFVASGVVYSILAFLL